MKAAVIGGSGYVGGELLRLLVRHPEVEVAQVTSDSRAGEPVARVHPNLRGAIDLNFVPRAALADADVTFVATPHGQSMAEMPGWLARGGLVVDASADFRLRDPDQYPRYYATSHPHPELLAMAVYGLPELHRREIPGATLIATPGCIATAAILALRPLVQAGIVEPTHVVVDAKSGSSAGGADGGPAGNHPERSGVMRLYAPVHHRHAAEIAQETGLSVALSCHAVEAVRGVLVTCHLWTTHPVTEKDLWRIYRGAYSGEPFVRIVHDAAGIYRQPEPKLLAGTNFCDVGFAVDSTGSRVVAVAALDNLMKGAAGNAIQSLNLWSGWSETLGLDFLGLHPS